MERKDGYVYSSNYSEDEMNLFMKQALVALGDIMIVNAQGQYIWASDGYGDSMDLKTDEIIDKKITDVLDHTDIPSVLKTGHPLISTLYQRGDRNYWLNRVPLLRDGKVVGAVGQAIMTDKIESGEIKKKLAYLTRSLNYYKDKYNEVNRVTFSPDSLIAKSRIMVDLKDTLTQIAATRSTVLISGESGTGKEVFANAIHCYSPRAQKPFIRINCAAIPDTLLESELFGYEEGAFTGAVKGGKIGDFEAADGGTILLDEVDSLTPNLQAKLLRVIQEKEIKKVGSTKSVPVDVRFIFATNKDLYKMVQSGKFREDFYYRINVINLKLPALRERPDDIPPLVEHFIKKYNSILDMSITGIAPGAMLLLQNHNWPGNIRELENCIERAFNYAGSGELQPSHFQLSSTESNSEPAVYAASTSLKDVREQAERRAIIQTLRATAGNKKEAAEILGIDRSILYDKIKKYNINDEQV